MDGWTDRWVIYDLPDKEFGRGSWADSLKHCGATENVARRTNKECGRGSPAAPPSLRCRTTVEVEVEVTVEVEVEIEVEVEVEVKVEVEVEVVEVKVQV